MEKYEFEKRASETDNTRTDETIQRDSGVYILLCSLTHDSKLGQFSSAGRASEL